MQLSEYCCFTTVLSAGLVLLPGIATADCPVSLPVETLYACIVAESEGRQFDAGEGISSRHDNADGPAAGKTTGTGAPDPVTEQSITP